MGRGKGQRLFPDRVGGVRGQRLGLFGAQWPQTTTRGGHAADPQRHWADLPKSAVSACLPVLLADTGGHHPVEAAAERDDRVLLSQLQSGVRWQHQLESFVAAEVVVRRRII